MQELEIIQRIQQLCAARNWTLYRLAKESGITYSTLCTMLHKETTPSIPTLTKLCQGFGISLSEFFDTTNDWAMLTPGQKMHLSFWNSLNSQNQDAVNKYMTFLLQAQGSDAANKDPQ